MRIMISKIESEENFKDHSFKNWIKIIMKIRISISFESINIFKLILENNSLQGYIDLWKIISNNLKYVIEYLKENKHIQDKILLNKKAFLQLEQINKNEESYNISNQFIRKSLEMTRNFSIIYNPQKYESKTFNNIFIRKGKSGICDNLKFTTNQFSKTFYQN